MKLAVVMMSLALAAGAQDLSLKQGKVAHVTAAPISTVTVRAGTAAQVDLPFRVAPGFHINSHQPGSDLLIPTAVHLNPPTDIAVEKVTYPKGEDLSFSFAPDQKLNVYQGDFEVTAMVSPTRNTTAGRYRVHGMLKYQACDDRACYPATQVPVAFDVQVLKALNTRTRRNPAQSPHVH